VHRTGLSQGLQQANKYRERFSTARHHLGIYRCVGNTARYSTSHNIEDLSSSIGAAVAKVLFNHSALCCGIINEDKNDPAFIRLETIDISKRIEYQEIEANTAEDHDRRLIEVLEAKHSELWPDPKTLPPWKLIIIQSKALSTEGPGFDAVFAFHHALGDGLSGVAFHRSFLQALNNSSDDTLASPFVKVPESITLPPAMEKSIDFKISWWFLLTQLWNEMRPRWLFPDALPPWTASPCSAANIQNYKSRMKIFTIEPNLVVKILAACRTEKATVTGLLHGLIVTSLASHVPEASSFASGTPFSLRHLSRLSVNAMGVQVSGHTSKYTTETLSRIRSSTSPEQVTNDIWTIAREFRASMNAELAALPNDNLVGLIPYISNLHKMFESKIGKPREETYELSNVGVLKNESIEGRWRIERDVFSQSGMGTGAPVAFNVASVGGGPMSISVTWLQGDIEERLVDGLVKDVEFGLRCMGEGKEVFLEF